MVRALMRGRTSGAMLDGCARLPVVARRGSTSPSAGAAGAAAPGFSSVRHRQRTHAANNCGLHVYRWPMADDVARGGIGSLRVPC
eukprot:4882254-Prymnesium_polylepis.1